MLCAALVLAWALPVLADRIVTTSGQVFEGQILEQDQAKVVIKTASGVVVIPRIAIQAANVTTTPKPQTIKPATIDPLQAAQAYAEAEAAVNAGDWIKAGSLLEGLMQLDGTAFPHEKRVAGTAALATCYLQVKDPEGAAKAFERRAKLVDPESDKKRLLAAAEAIRKCAGPMIGGIAFAGVLIDNKPVGRYEEAVDAAMGWKAAQVLEEAKEIGRKATDLDDKAKLDDAVKRLTEKVAEADLYVPGFSLLRRKDVLMSLTENVVPAVQKAVELCTEERKHLSGFWRTSAASVRLALQFNEKARAYLIRRQAAEDGLKNLRILAEKEKTAELCDEKVAAPLFVQLADLQYHLTMPWMPQRPKIALRKIGSDLCKNR